MAEKRSILHFITPLKNVSPFDVNYGRGRRLRSRGALYRC